jgi:hypothetical protein
LYFEPLHKAFDAVFKDGTDMADALESAAEEITKEYEAFKIYEGDT